jgi:hypothetical protein
MHQIKGNTYPIKDQLKRLGCRWSSLDKCWETPSTTTYEKAMSLMNGEPLPPKKEKESVPPSRPDFEEKLKTFIEGCKRISDEWHDANGFKREDIDWTPRWHKRWVKIHWTYVDIATGEVLKSGGRNRPAITQISRGNIFDEHNGLKWMTAYGPAYSDDIRRGDVLYRVPDKESNTENKLPTEPVLTALTAPERIRCGKNVKRNGNWYHLLCDCGYNARHSMYSRKSGLIYKGDWRSGEHLDKLLRELAEEHWTVVPNDGDPRTWGYVCPECSKKHELDNQPEAAALPTQS